MRLFIRHDLVKSEQKGSADSSKPVNAHDGGSTQSGGRGEQRGGHYVARTQIGYEKDGSPKYRYFKTEEEYETYLKGKGKSPEAKKLEHKVKREHDESTDKHTGLTVHKPASHKPGLLASDKPVSKSLRLFLKV